MKTPTHIMIHHSAVSSRLNRDQLRAINNYHQALWNFKSSLGFYVGYNYLINPAGRATKCREEGEETAACYQGNMNNGQCVHICLEGNFDLDKPAANQIYKLRDLLKELVKKYKILPNDIVPHNAYAPKSCPGVNIDMNFVRSLVGKPLPVTAQPYRPSK